jgi:hypothetical protein
MQSKKYYQTDEFKELADEWEEILKEAGLPDIEKSVGKKRVLKQNSPNVYRQMDPVRREAKEQYFRELNRCLHAACFDCSVDRVVMVLKAEGAKIVEICVALEKLGMRRYRRTVRLIVRKYEDRWGIKSWSPEQLRYRWKKKPVT